jgi:DNA-binding transcriptional MerR regulator
MSRTYTNKEAASITGVTQRQILSWSEKGLIHFSNESEVATGRKRQYDFQSLVELKFAAELFKFGFGFRLIKNILNRTRGKLKDHRNLGVLRISLSEMCLLQFQIGHVLAFIFKRLYESKLEFSQDPHRQKTARHGRS